LKDATELSQALTALNRTLVEIEMGKIEYQKNNEVISYEGGGVWRREEGSNSSSMVSPPEFQYSRRGQTLTLPLFNVTSQARVSASSSSNLRVGAETDQLFDESPIVGGTVKARVESDYYRAWADYFDSRTEGDIVEDYIYDSNETATVDLEVPIKTEIDGGHAFQGSADADWFDGYPSTNEFSLGASGLIEETINEAQSDNDNSDFGCIDASGFNSCGTICLSDDYCVLLQRRS